MLQTCLLNYRRLFTQTPLASLWEDCINNNKKAFSVDSRRDSCLESKEKNFAIVQMELNASTTMKERENTHVFGVKSTTELIKYKISALCFGENTHVFGFIPVTTTSVYAVDISYPHNLWGLFCTTSICYLWY